MSVLARFIDGEYKVESIDGHSIDVYPAHDVRFAIRKLNGASHVTDAPRPKIDDINLNW